MSTAQARMFVMVGTRFACVKIVGRATFASSIDFKTLVNELRQKGYSYFILDLSECVLMDSTFLGVLAGFGLKLAHLANGDPAIELLNPNARLAELLESLGVLHLFRLTQGSLQVPQETESHEHAPLTPTKDETRQACLEAHQTLMQINPENISKFKEVAQFLAEDLKRLKTGA